MHYSIAIDGPAGSGKSTIAKSIAKGLRFTYIDTGAMYRAITLKALDLGIKDLGNENEYSFLESTTLSFDGPDLIMDGINVKKEIREQRIVDNVSLVSSLKRVREVLVLKQREMAETTDVVMDGRDIGTNVLKNATIKIFLSASVNMRAERRYQEVKDKGSSMTKEEVLADLIRRDEFDTNREHNPLRKAVDAIEIDNSDMTIEETAQKIMHLFKERVL